MFYHLFQKKKTLYKFLLTIYTFNLLPHLLAFDTFLVREIKRKFKQINIYLGLSDIN